jgi:hypothetical protein
MQETETTSYTDFLSRLEQERFHCVQSKRRKFRVSAALAKTNLCTLHPIHSTNTVGDQLQALSPMCDVCRVPGLGEENREYMIGNMPERKELFL